MSKNKTVRKLFLTVFCFFAGVILARAESCPLKGQVQYKANGGCETSERTCCPNKQWSEWDGECSNQDDCTDIGYWWDGSACVECTNLKESAAHYTGNGGTENKCPFECEPGVGYADIEGGYCSTTCSTGDWFNPADNTCSPCNIPANAWATSDGYGSADSCPWECESGYHKPRNYTGSLVSKTTRGCFASTDSAYNYFYNTSHNAHDLWNNNRSKCDLLNAAYEGNSSYGAACTNAFEDDTSSGGKNVSCPYVYSYKNCSWNEDYEWAEMYYSCSPGEYRNICVRD